MGVMEFADELAAAAGQPHTAFRALEKLAEATVGARLFTLMTVNLAIREGMRVHTSMPEIYPVTGRKPLPEGIWTDQVIDRRLPFVANSIDDIAEVFPDHGTIASLGCGAVLNIPVVVAGEVTGTINCLHQADWYTEERVGRASELRLPGAACFLLVSHLFNQKEF